MNMEELLENSVRLYPGIVIKHSRGGEEALSLLIFQMPAGFFVTHNSTVCFVVDNEFYVTPSTRQVLKVLDDAGFKENFGLRLYVPFSNGDVPKLEAKEWARLCKNAREAYKLEFADDCGKRCDALHIGRLPEDFLAACFRMPESGIPIIDRSSTNNVYYPILSRLGEYSIKNGVSIFIYRDGATYLAKGDRAEDELQSAGFRRGDFFVPFSNGEKITDPALEALWNSIPKK